MMTFGCVSLLVWIFELVQPFEKHAILCVLKNENFTLVSVFITQLGITMCSKICIAQPFIHSIQAIT